MQDVGAGRRMTGPQPPSISPRNLVGKSEHLTRLPCRSCSVVSSSTHACLRRLAGGLRATTPIHQQTDPIREKRMVCQCACLVPPARVDALSMDCGGEMLSAASSSAGVFPSHHSCLAEYVGDCHWCSCEPCQTSDIHHLPLYFKTRLERAVSLIGASKQALLARPQRSQKSISGRQVRRKTQRQASRNAAGFEQDGREHLDCPTPAHRTAYLSLVT
ncbi:hypothetical protein HDK77DRAFT_33871 [Phyllosticta capitalensis]